MQSKWKPSIIVLSIHFPLTREDQNHQGEPDGRDPFNPLPSHEGRRGVKFLSNFSVSFNPLPSHEGRPLYFFSGDVNMDFQSTSLSRGKTFRVAFRVASFHFQSTSLSRGKTVLIRHRGNVCHLSIHFPLTREDILAGRILQS